MFHFKSAGHNSLKEARQTGRSDFMNTNPLGLGGLQYRIADRFVIGVTAICGAETKRTGLPCRAAPCLKHGSLRCRRHGGRSKGMGVLAIPKSARVSRNQSMHMLRKAARETLAGMTLHPDAMSVFSRYANEIYEPNSAMLILSCDQFARNEIDASQLRLAVEMARKRY